MIEAMSNDAPDPEILRLISDRISDLHRIYHTLNDSHIDTQVKLERLCAEHEALKVKNEDDHDYIKDIVGEMDEFVNTAQLIFKIVKWFITPSVIIIALSKIYEWLVSIQ